MLDENVAAVKFLVMACFQMLERVSTMYKEMARFVLRLLGYKLV